MKISFYITRLCFVLLLGVATPVLKAQQLVSIREVMEEFKNLREAYMKAGTLSFDIRYQYTNESNPAVILDSIFGKVEMNGKSYRYILDNTETVMNDKYTITLFKENKLMYLSKSSQKNMPGNPLAMLDSTISRIPGLKCAIRAEKNSKTISFDFPAGMQYKRIDYTIDAVTGFMTKAVYLVKTEQMMDNPKETKSLGNRQYDEYSRVEARFYNYSTSPVSNAMFDENRYFTRNGKEFKTTDAYKEFKIFIASPNF